MRKKVLLILLLLIMISCNKTSKTESKFDVGIKNLEENRFKEAEEAFLQVEKSVNKEVNIYLLRLYEKTGNKDKIKEVYGHNIQDRTWSTEEKSLGTDTPLTTQHPSRISRTRIHESRQPPEP